MEVADRLAGKVALVTGASAGNGLNTAEKLARAGADVYLTAIDGESKMREAAHRCRAANPRVRVEWGVFDLAEHASPAGMVNDALSRLGRVDILVNNVAIRSSHAFGDYSCDDFDAVVAVNLRAAFLASQAVLPAMREQGGGRIIHVASQLGIVAYKESALYGMAKAGLIFLGRAMAVELGRENIIVNTISPGVIMSERNVDRVKRDPGYVAERLVDIPAGRFGDPHEIADAILYLASDAPAYLQGHNLVVDGGYVCH